MTHPPSPADPSPDIEPAFEFDAFISYSRKDTAVAEALERALERYRPPSGLGLPTRHLNVFRDVDDFTGSDYQASVDRHLRRARRLIVLCSPAARASRYVDDEIARFAAARGPEAIIPVLVDGIPNNEATAETESRAAFPRALCAAIPMPLAVPLKDFDPDRDRISRGRFENSWYTLLANLHGVSRAEVERRDFKRRRKRLVTAVTTTAAVVVGLATLSVVALIQRGQARRAQAAAEDRAAVALAGGVMDRSLESAALLMLEVRDPTTHDDALGLLAELATARGGWLELARWSQPGASELAFSSDGELLRVTVRDSVVFRDAWSGALRPRPAAETAFPSPLTSTDPSGRRRIDDADGVTPALIDESEGNTIVRLATDDCVDRHFFGPEGKTVIGFCMSGGEVGIWETETGIRTATLPGRVLGPRAITADGTRLVLGPGYAMGNSGRGVSVDVAELPSGDLTARLELSGEVEAYAISPSGHRIAVSSTTGEVRVWSTEGSGLDAGPPTGSDSGVSAAPRPSPEPASASWQLDDLNPAGWSLSRADGQGAAIPLGVPRPAALLRPDFDSLRPDLVFSPDSSAVFAWGDGGRSRVAPDPMAWLWDTAEGRLLLEIPGEVAFVAFHPRGDLMATLVVPRFSDPGAPGLLTLWNYETATRIVDIPEVAATGLSFSDDGGHLAIETPAGGLRRLAVAPSVLQARLRARLPGCLPADQRQRLLGATVEEARRAAEGCDRCLVRQESVWDSVRQGMIPAEEPWKAFRSCRSSG